MLPQTLKEVLHKARPDWTSRELSAVQSKLERVEIFKVVDLEDALDEHLKGHVNVRLQQIGLKTFTDQTLLALKCAVRGEQPPIEEGEEVKGPKAMPTVRRSQEVVPVVSQHRNIRIERERMVSRSTAAGWGVATFDAPSDFILQVRFARDAGPLAEPWRDYVLIGLVPWDVQADQIAMSDQPWDWGAWVAPGTSPMQVWTRTRHPGKPILVTSLQAPVLAQQTLRLKRNAHGMVGVSVDDGAVVRLPASACWGRSGTTPMMRPAVLLGLNTEVQVWITLFSEARGAPNGEDSREDAANGRSAESAREDVKQAVPEDGAEDRPVEAAAESVSTEDQPGDLSIESAGEALSEDVEQEVHDLPQGPTTPKEARLEEVQKARKSKKYSVGDLVGFFETKRLSSKA